MNVIEWSYGHCTLGSFLAGRRGEAFVWLAFGTPAPSMIRSLIEAFPEATVRTASESSAAAWMLELTTYLDADGVNEVAARPPIALEGTEFQQEVWRVLLEIPWGETRSYGALAEAMGRSTNAARAVGTACGANKLAVLVPCHRVVGLSGDLRGFRWGEELKAELLRREASQQALF